MQSSNWLELPSHLQALFMNKLVSIKDYLRFGAVCSSWRSVFSHHLDHKQLPPQLPLLMFHSVSPSIAKGTMAETLKFYCLAERRVVHDLEIKLRFSHCRGSKHGWLVFIEDYSNFPVRLYNPFLSVNNKIELPPLKSLQLHVNQSLISNYISLKKAFPSKNPTSNPNDFVVIGIVSFVGIEGQVAFCKPGDKAWSILPSQWKDFDDVTYYKGLFYAVRHLGEVIAIDLPITDDSSTQQHPVLAPKVTSVAPGPPSDLNRCIETYIVESSGDLLQVQRFYDTKRKRNDDRIVTNMFRVFKLLFNPDKEEQDQGNNVEDSKWVEVKTLAGSVLFLGDNASISLSASDFPGCKHNCIYFTDQFCKFFTSSRPQDIGVFNLEDGNIQQLIYPLRTNPGFLKRSIWVEPSLQQ